MCMAALERPEAHSLLDELERSVIVTDAKDQVRMADKQLSVGFRFGFVRHLSNSRAVWELVDHVDDPFIRCSFLSMHAWALVLGAYYDEALEAARRLLADATDFRVRPALPYGHASEAISLAGLGESESALASIDRAEREARRVHDVNGVQNAYAIRVPDSASSRRCRRSLRYRATGHHGRAVEHARGGARTRALALATIGRLGEAAELADMAATCTGGIEAQALCKAVTAVRELKSRGTDLLEAAENS